MEHLIELSLAEAKVVPTNWVQISSTKQVARFHTPRTINLQEELQCTRDEIKIAAKAAWSVFLREVATCLHGPLRAVSRVLGEVDAFLSLAKVAILPGYVQPHYGSADTDAVRVKPTAIPHASKESEDTEPPSKRTKSDTLATDRLDTCATDREDSSATAASAVGGGTVNPVGDDSGDIDNAFELSNARHPMAEWHMEKSGRYNLHSTSVFIIFLSLYVCSDATA